MISASLDIKEPAMAAGADDFLAKPFEMNERNKTTKSKNETPGLINFIIAQQVALHTIIGYTATWAFKYVLFFVPVGRYFCAKCNKGFYARKKERAIED